MELTPESQIYYPDGEGLIGFFLNDKEYRLWQWVVDGKVLQIILSEVVVGSNYKKVDASNKPFLQVDENDVDLMGMEKYVEQIVVPYFNKVIEGMGDPKLKPVSMVWVFKNYVSFVNGKLIYDQSN